MASLVVSDTHQSCVCGVWETSGNEIVFSERLNAGLVKVVHHPLSAE